jgi:hypothetical protein
MSIIRRQKVDGGWVAIPNSVLVDDRLSIEAKGVLCYLLSLPDNWEVRLPQVAATLKIGRDKCQRIMSELREAGYVHLHVGGQQADGKMVGSEYLVYDTPEMAATCGKPGNGFSGSRSTENRLFRAPENQVLHKENNTESTNTKKNRKKDSGEATLFPSEPPQPKPSDRFDEFWALCPKKVDPPAARRAWKAALKKVSADVIIAGMQRYADHCRREKIESKFQKTPGPWLNGERWNEQLEPSASRPTGVRIVTDGII